jgi:hypothetical protein
MFGWLFRSKSVRPDLEERVEKAERALQSLKTDWLEFEEKVQRAVWRAAKRKEPVGQIEEETVPPEQPARYRLGAPRAPATAVGHDPLSEAIRARRGLRVMRDPSKLNGEDA